MDMPKSVKDTRKSQCWKRSQSFNRRISYADLRRR